VQASQEINRDLNLKDRFNIEIPIFNYESLQFELEYVVSDMMGDTFVAYRVFDGHLCQEGNNDITENDYLLSRLRPDLKPVGDGDGFRTMKVTLNVDPVTIASSPIYEDSITSANVYFCVRFSVYNMDFLDPNALEVNFLETPVQLTIDLVDGFAIVAEVTNSALVLELAYEDSAVEAYICDSEANVLEGDVKSQGESVRVCVVPNEETLAEGALLRYIEEFTFTREEHEQVAILPGTEGAPATELTVVSCEAGSVLCAFETLLGAEFFYGGVGIVHGTGTAFLQFGEGEVVRRRLQVGGDWGDKSPAEQLKERPTAFNFDIVALPKEDPTSSSSSMSMTFVFIAVMLASFY
jgi:hypothetical protein